MALLWSSGIFSSFIRHLQSGDVVTVTIDDPELLPLPSFEILQLQWILHRVRALDCCCWVP